MTVSIGKCALMMERKISEGLCVFKWPAKLTFSPWRVCLSFHRLRFILSVIILVPQSIYQAIPPTHVHIACCTVKQVQILHGSHSKPSFLMAGCCEWLSWCFCCGHSRHAVHELCRSIQIKQSRRYSSVQSLSVFASAATAESANNNNNEFLLLLWLILLLLYHSISKAFVDLQTNYIILYVYILG